jgi:hypothetical protein
VGSAGAAAGCSSVAVFDLDLDAVTGFAFWSLTGLADFLATRDCASGSADFLGLVAGMMKPQNDNN